ncbi:MAG: ATP-binding cassette domain-containing protein [Aquihabitans sp.]
MTLSIPSRGPVVVAGPSGAGKSSLLRLLNRLDAPSAGSVTYMGEDLSATNPIDHRRRVAMVFQRPVVLPGTVADNVREADPGLDDAQVAATLDRVGLDPGLADRDAQDLSGGEAQRMCLARSLATKPEVVLFDEPTSSLDPANALRIERLAVSLEEQGITSIWVTHDLDQLKRLAAHLVVVIDGRIAQSGPVAEVLTDPCPGVATFLDGGA